MSTRREELINNILAAPNENHALKLMDELNAELIRERHLPKLQDIEARLANWLVRNYDRQELLGYTLTANVKGEQARNLRLATDLDECNVSIHTLYLLPSPDVEAASDVILDEVDLNASGRPGSILRFRLGTEWYTATISLDKC